jgi:low affinity Fe/Cu permease
MKFVEKISVLLTRWVGTPASIVIHTLAFVGMFVLVAFGWKLNTMLLVLTSALSIEAIYLALFIQMTVNKASKDLEEVGKDIDIIQADDKNDDVYDEQVSKTLNTIDERINRLQKDLRFLKKKGIM